MINKALRIMIADPQHVQRLRLEREFNGQGYYAIAPVSSLEEWLTLLACGMHAFDLVLVNASLAAGTDFDLSAYCQDHPLIRQVLIYDLAERGMAVMSAQVKGRTARDAVQLPSGLKHRFHLQAQHQRVIDVLA